MQKFKVGDRIRFTGNATEAPDTGTVTKVNDNEIWAKWDSDGALNFLGIHSPYLRALAYPETPPQPKSPPFRQPIPALPTDSAKRKEFPMYSGLLAYFPAALARVSNHSFVGNQKHNAGKPLQHARGVSGDHSDCIVRHLVDAAEHRKGSDGRIEELSALAWRALALLQEELELAGTLPAPGATFDNVVPQ